MGDNSNNDGDIGYLVAPPLKVDVVEGRIWLDDEAKHVGQKAFRLLCALMQRPEKLWTKDELIEIVWDGRSVTDAVLTTAMKELRKALAEPARNPQFIETVHGRGYRFLLPVKAIPAQGAEQQGLSHTDREAASDVETAFAAKAENSGRAVRSRPTPIGQMVVGITLLFALAVMLLFSMRDSLETGDGEAVDVTYNGGATPNQLDPRSIAVLPFEDLSGETAEAWFVGGLTEELSSTLAKAPGLRVIVGKESNQDVRTLNAAHILEGSVRRSESRVRITARLVRASDRQSVWSQSYDRTNAEIIGIQEDIALQIAQSLRVVMEPGRLEQMVEAGTRSVEAYEALLAGHHYLRQQYITGKPEYRRRSYEEYERARALDPNFSEAHWQAARYWFERSTYIFPPGEEESILATQEASQRFEDRINAAIESAADEIAAQLYTATFYAHRLEYRTAHRLLGNYVQQRPRDAYAWVLRLRVAAYVGEYEVARAAARELAALADQTSLYFTRTIPNLMWAWDFEMAEQQAWRSLELAPENAFVQYHAHRALLWVGKNDEAKKLLPQIAAGELAAHNKKLAAMRQACAEGNQDEAEFLATEIRNLTPPRVAANWLAEMLLGRSENANAVLDPYDAEGSLHQLAPFLIYPHFDSTAFATLSSKLTAEDIDRPTPLPLPYTCS